MPFAHLSVMGSDHIKPGEPVTLSWSVDSDVWRHSSEHFDMGNAVAVVSFNGMEIARHQQGILIDYGYVNRISDDGSHWELEFRNNSSAAPQPITDILLPNEFYRIGTHTLQLEVTGDGPNRGPLSAQEHITVVRETVDQTWWNWTSPVDPNHIEWNRQYDIGGVFINHSNFSAMQMLSFNLNEIERNGGNQASRGSTNVGSVARGSGRSPIPFSPITQNWHWLIPVIWVADGPRSNVFEYTSSGTFQDEYGNQYQLTSADFDVFVNVSLLKGLAAMEGMQCMEVAAGLLVAAAIQAVVPVIGWALATPWFVAAGVVVSLAAGWGAIALDPPELDMDYRKKVEVIPLDLPKEITQPEFTELASFFEVMAKIIGAITALDKVEGKRMGLPKLGINKP